MSPKRLTDHQKEIQRRKLLQKGSGLLLSQGVRKLSVDEIVKAAGMAKGSFYLHFASKEEFLFAVIQEIHEKSLQQAERMLLADESRDLRERLRSFIKELFQQPEYVFLVKEHEYLDELYASVLHDQVQSLTESECASYDRILELAGIDTTKVKAAVVLNCVHTIFTGVYDNELMIEEYIAETLDVLIEGLVAYIVQDNQ